MEESFAPLQTVPLMRRASFRLAGLDLSPTSLNPLTMTNAPPERNSVTRANRCQSSETVSSAILAQKTIADFQIAFSGSSLRGATRLARVPGTRAAYTGAENYRRLSNRVFWVQFARCNSLSARAWHASGEAQLVNRFRLTSGQSISVDSWSIEFG